MKYFLLLTIILQGLVSYGQRQITGRVLDSETKKPIKLATVYVEGDSLTTQTNALGFFQLNVDSTDILNIKCDGYNTGQVRVPPKGGIQILLENSNFPEYKGGYQELYGFWGQNFKYPYTVRNKNLQGRVFISFEIDSTGSLGNIKVLKDIGENCGEELTKIIKLTPNNWIPINRTCTFILPITLKLSNNLFDVSSVDKDILENELKTVTGKLLSEIVITAPPK
jgi:hypothetical protein